MVQDFPDSSSKRSKRRLFLILLFVIFVVLIGIFYKLHSISKQAQRSDATVDWKAVLTGKNPIYKTKYRVVKIEYADLAAVEKTIEDFHLQVDVWNNESRHRKWLFGQATDTAIRTLRERGYTVTILYNSYSEYQDAIEKKYGE